MTSTLGRIGVWSRNLRITSEDRAARHAADLERLGFGAVFLPDVLRVDVFDRAQVILRATSSLAVATGILTVHTATPAEAAERHARLSGQFPGRFLLGLGVSHGKLSRGVSPRMVLPDRPLTRPLETMGRYLDGLDAAPEPVPKDERFLAALGPRMTALAAQRTAGVHSYLAPPSHTAKTRARLGPGPLIAAHQAVVLETDPARARRIARTYLRQYLRLHNYVRNLAGEGFGDADVSGRGSDRLVDSLVAWGDAGAIARRVREHHDAGADHVCMLLFDSRLDAGMVTGPITGRSRGEPIEHWRALAGALA